jgi:hypothetical protein
LVLAGSALTIFAEVPAFGDALFDGVFTNVQATERTVASGR